MARGRSRSKATDEQTVESTDGVGTQEGAEEQAPESTEESTVTVTEPEVEATEPQAEPQAEPEAEPEATEATPEQSGDTGGAQSDGEQASGESTENKSKDDLVAEFYAQCEVGVTESDETTGSVPDLYIDRVLVAYRNLPSTTAKSDVKNWLGEEMRQALIKSEINRARALSDINAKVQDASTRRSAATPSKPAKSVTETWLDTCLTLDIAKQFVVRPKEEELDENWEAVYHQRFADYNAEGGPVATYMTWLRASEADRGEEPEVDQVVKNAAKLAAGKAVGGRKSGGTRKSSGGSSGVRRNVGAHIDEFLAQADPNAEYTVADVANFSSQEYGDDHPSPGAVAARLFPGKGKASTIEGFEQVPDVEPKKIRKI